MCFKHILWKCPKEESLTFPLKGLKARGASTLWSLRNNTVNHQLPAQRQMGVTGAGNDKSCRQRLLNSFTYLQPHSHTIQRSCSELSWLPASPPGPAQGLAGVRTQDRHGTKPTDFISISQFPSAFHPTGHIGQGHFPCSYLRETSISSWLVLF